MDEPWREDPAAPNNGPQTNGAVWAFVAVATLFLGLRVACKCGRHSQLWCDDWFLVVSWILLIVSCILMSINVAAGLGKHDKDINPKIVDQLGLRNLIISSLYTVSSAWSKTSFAISLLRIATPRLRVIIWFLIVTMNIFMHTSAVLTWVTCRPMEKLWDFTLEGECWPSEIIIPTGIFFNAYSGFMDLILALLSWIIIIRLQINIKERIGVAVAMSMGIL
ncbi:hypothetical protein F4804DRAFT_344554 [Jackrogersella minutella]|nr:hypothetical protein F4804DRAFT_344554 [Jackrogersella minutella]